MLCPKETEKLFCLANSLKLTKDLGERQEILLNEPRVQDALSTDDLLPFILSSGDLSTKNALFAIAAINQHRNVLAYPKRHIPREAIRSLLATLTQVDKFYESIGGIVGYQALILKFSSENVDKKSSFSFSRAHTINLETDSHEKINGLVVLGLEALAELGEIYPIGGLGSRLNLLSKNGEPLPAAMLSFAGRTLLEGLIRDLQAREFCYYRLFGKQITVPIGMMTSKEKQNDYRIKSLCEKKRWFGRPKESFYLFSQLSVPVVAQNGQWSLKAPLQLNLQPGGHGALWRTAEEKGIFSWFLNQEKHRLLIRQINNPIAGVDHGLLVLVGAGKNEDKSFGFAACERLKHAAEGALMLIEEDNLHKISNIEYTDFKRYGVEERLEEEAFPANTNILYADLSKLMSHIKKNPLPGLVFNAKNKIPVMKEDGKVVEVFGGRLESMMQNISDSLTASKNEKLPTFVTFNKRRKTISAAKKTFEKDLLETPEGAFYDLLCNAKELLENHCMVRLPPFPSVDEYLGKGPSFLFLYHPALGPLYQIISQKIKRGQFSYSSELQLEIADAILDNIDLDGSLLIEAKNLLGHPLHGIIRYSQRTGKCVLKNVKVRNKGLLKSSFGPFWKNTPKRVESLKIILEGNSEFYAENIHFEGDLTIVVPDKERWVAVQDKRGMIQFLKEMPDWNFTYRIDEEKNIKLHFCQDKIYHKLS